ncbi:MAG TPA: YciI family protein [Acidobacteriaceae bacterium]
MALRRRMLWVLLAGLFLQTAAVSGQNGMTRYFVAFLRRSPERKPLAKEEAERIQLAHMANIRKMAADGVLVSAGPFEDEPPTISGIFIFKTDSLATAQRIAAADPTVVEHRNIADVHAWMGPPGIGDEYVRLHKQDPKTPDNMQVHPLCMMYRGAVWESMGDRRDAVMAEHRKYMMQLRDQGKLSAGGPMEQPGDLVGLVIYRPIALEEAQRLEEADPAVKAGVLRPEFHRWWSSDHVLPW